MAGNEKESALARIYANAMLDLAEKNGQADELRDELQALARLLKDRPELNTFFSSPMIDSKKRAVSLEKIFRGKIGDLLLDSLQVLNRKDRLNITTSVVEEYRLAHEALRGIVDVHVTTAVPLDDAARVKLRAAAKHYSGREAELVETVDPAILGGMIVFIEDQKIDTSLLARVRAVSDRLAERASREIHAGRTYVA